MTTINKGVFLSILLVCLYCGCKLDVSKKSTKSIEMKKYNNDDKLIEKYYILNDTLNGAYYSYFDQGNVKETGSYKKGNKAGLWKEYYENGKLKSKTLWKGIHGVYTEYDTSGTHIKKRGSIEGGNVLTGWWKTYNSHSTLIDSTFYIQGQKEGGAYFYDTERDIKCFSTFSNDLLMYGFCIDSNGDTISKTTLIDKHKNHNKVFYKNGNLQYEGYTNNTSGQAVGEWKKYNIKGWLEETFLIIREDSVKYKKFNKIGAIVESGVYDYFSIN